MKKARQKRIGRSLRRLFLGETKSINYKVAKVAQEEGLLIMLSVDLTRNPNKDCENPNYFCELTDKGKKLAKDLIIKLESI